MTIVIIRLGLAVGCLCGRGFPLPHSMLPAWSLFWEDVLKQGPIIRYQII